jgi:hypothetical protein
MQPAPIDTNTLITGLHNAGMPSRQIETIVNLDHSTICQRLKHLTPRKSTEIYKTKRADIFAELQRKILNTVDLKSIKTMAVRDRIMAMGILYDKEAMVRGQNDSNIKPMVTINIQSMGIPAMSSSIDMGVQLGVSQHTVSTNANDVDKLQGDVIDGHSITHKKAMLSRATKAINVKTGKR